MSEKELDTINQALRARPKPNVNDVEGMRHEIERFAQMLSPVEGAERTDVRIGDRAAAWFTPAPCPERTVLYLHGGGFAVGSIESHGPLVAKIARTAPARCLLVDYRLAPEHPFPAGLEDSAAAYRWLLSEGISPEKIMVMGDSAGGALTVATLLKLRDDGVPLPAAAVCLSPWVDLTMSGNSMIENAGKDRLIQRDLLQAFADMYLAGGEDPRNPYVSPMYADLAGLPPLLIQAGSAETLLDDSRQLAQRAAESNVTIDIQIWENMVHVWHFFHGYLSEADEAIEVVGRFLRHEVP